MIRWWSLVEGYETWLQVSPAISPVGMDPNVLSNAARPEIFKPSPHGRAKMPLFDDKLAA
jgi:hypothetical protein